VTTVTTTNIRGGPIDGVDIIRTPGGAIKLSPKAQAAHCGIVPAPGMTRNEFKRLAYQSRYKSRRGAFVDASGQLAVVELRGEHRRAYPKALGLWNYLAGQVLAELLVDRGEYDTVDEAYRDADVIAIFNWPKQDVPGHLLISQKEY
jgi:hypothetical protein